MNKKVIGFMKDEAGGRQIEEFVGLRRNSTHLKFTVTIRCAATLIALEVVESRAVLVGVGKM